MSCDAGKKRYLGCLTRFDTNRPVHVQTLKNFGYKKKRNCTICVAKTKALISCAVTA